MLYLKVCPTSRSLLKEYARSSQLMRDPLAKFLIDLLPSLLQPFGGFLRRFF